MERWHEAGSIKREARVSASLINGFAEDLDAIDDRDDGGIHGNQFQALGGTGRAALAKEDKFAFTRAHGVDGDNGVLAVLEFGRVLVIYEFGAKQEKFPSDHEFVFFRRDYLSDDFCEKHLGKV